MSLARLSDTQLLEERIRYELAAGTATTDTERKVAERRLAEVVAELRRRGSSNNHETAPVGSRWPHVPMVEVMRELGARLSETDPGKWIGGHFNKHDSRSGASLVVWSNEGVWYCSSCKRGGDIAVFVADHFAWDYRQAARWLIERYGEAPTDIRVAPWPEPPSIEAFYGLAGDFVRVVEPHSEADPVALLVQFLAAFGNVIGHGPHFEVEATKHSLNLYACLVGATSKGRKGTSLDHIRWVFRGVDAQWLEGRWQNGLGSGEGVIWAVRDPIYRRESLKEKGRPTGEVINVCVDSGVEDKRLFVTEDEFSSPLRVMTREGNTLSPVLRRAWDSGNLNQLIKNNPAKATEAHISVIGHITKEELLRYLAEVDMANGFGNRFLWTCVRRSKCLPEGGCLRTEDVEPIIQRLEAAVDFARDVDVMRRDDEARRAWHAVYPALSEAKPGLPGAILNRAEAQVMRLACIYALLDCSRVVRIEHLRAALALWEYCEASAEYVFGESAGDPVCDRILQALQEAGSDGLSRTDISGLFERNKSAKEIAQALKVLIAAGRVRREVTHTTGKGRPLELWYATN